MKATGGRFIAKERGILVAGSRNTSSTGAQEPAASVFSHHRKPSGPVTLSFRKVQPMLVRTMDTFFSVNVPVDDSMGAFEELPAFEAMTGRDAATVEAIFRKRAARNRSYSHVGRNNRYKDHRRASRITLTRDVVAHLGIPQA